MLVHVALIYYWQGHLIQESEGLDEVLGIQRGGKNCVVIQFWECEVCILNLIRCV